MKDADMTAPIDPLLQQRLAQLGGRRAGAALPPPTAASTRSTNTRPANKLPANKSGRRAKPARMAKLSALAISATTTLGLTMAFAHDGTQTDASGLLTVATVPVAGLPVAAAPVATTPPVAAAPVAAAPVATTPVAAPAVVAAPPAAAGIGDGTYVGASNSNRWGTVQVQVVYSGGHVKDVQILQYPDGDGHSVRISQIALPELVSEALSSRSADVNTVSGAPYTSKSYRVSLQSAIDAAKSASGISG